jgi:hypothetical protein
LNQLQEAAVVFTLQKVQGPVDGLARAKKKGASGIELFQACVNRIEYLQVIKMWCDMEVKIRLLIAICVKARHTERFVRPPSAEEIRAVAEHFGGGFRMRMSNDGQQANLWEAADAPPDCVETP